MSLINRMLKDLSSREPASANLMAGIQVPGAARARKPALLPRLGGLLVLITVFTAGLWWMFGPRSVPVPKPRAAAPASDSAATPVTAAPAVSLAQAPVTAQVASNASIPAPVRESDLSVFQLDTQLSGPPAAPENAVPVGGAQARYQQGLSAQQRGDLKTAERHYIKALTLDGGLHAAREQLIALRLDQNRIADARRSVQLGLQLAPNHVPYQQLAQRLASVNPTRQLDSAKRSTPSATPPAAADRAGREAQALKLIEEGRLAEAAEIVAQGMEEDPDWIGYRRLAARIELARNQPAAAVALLERDPPTLADDPEYHGLLASAYQRLNRHEDAARVYQGLLRSRPGEAHWWAGYGMSKDALGEVQEALNAYTQARQLGRLDARVLEYINRRIAALNDNN